jgi:hypothetical protein
MCPQIATDPGKHIINKKLIPKHCIIEKLRIEIKKEM